MRIDWLEVIDQMATIRIVSHLVPLEHFRKRASRDLVQTGHLFLDVTEPSEAATHIIGANKAGIVSNHSNLFITGEEDFLDSRGDITKHFR